MASNSEQGSILGKIATYTELLDKDPCSTIFVPLSEAYRQMGMIDDAVEVARNGIMQNPAFPAGYVALGRALVLQGEGDKAAAEFDKALTLDKKNLAALKALAQIKIQQGQLDKATEFLERAEQIKPEDVSVKKMLAVLAKKAAAAAIKETSSGAQATHPSHSEIGGQAGEPISTATIAEIYIKQGFPEKALKVYRDLLRADPQNDQLRRKLIVLKEKLVETCEDESTAAILEAKDVIIPRTDGGDTETFSTGMEEKNVAHPAPDGKSIIEVFSAWLEAIGTRREVHVQ